MSDQNQQVDTKAAREAAMSRVVTSETILEQLTNAGPATEDASKQEQTEAKDGEVKPKVKKTANERIQEVVEKRKAAEAKAEAAEARAKELEERIKRLEAPAPAIEPADKPKRADFASDADFEDALIDWKADQRIAKREQQQKQAKLAEDWKRVEDGYNKRVSETKGNYEDWDEVIKSAKVDVPHLAVITIMKDPHGADITYYLSKNQEEAKRIFAMDPDDMVTEIKSIGREFAPEPESKEPEAKPAKKKAPEPINPVKGTPLSNPGQAKSYEEYRAQRLAAKRR